MKELSVTDAKAVVGGSGSEEIADGVIAVAAGLVGVLLLPEALPAAAAYGAIFGYGAMSGAGGFMIERGWLSLK